MMEPRVRGSIATPTAFKQPVITVTVNTLGAVIRIDETDRPENWMEITVDHVVLFEWVSELMQQLVLQATDTASTMELIRAQTQRF